MDTKQIHQDALFEQLGLDLKIDEAELAADMGISPAEAKMRSETARMALEKRGEGDETPFWMDDYLMLRDHGWPWRVAAYISWAASPRNGRWPKTQLQLAQQVLNLNSDRVINTWRKKNAAIDEAVAIMQAMPLLQHRRDLYQALIDSATSSDYKSHPDRKLAFEMLGDYTPRTKVDVNAGGSGNDLADMTDEELKQIARGLTKKNPSTPPSIPPLRSAGEGG
jgi:hypothetical protein